MKLVVVATLFCAVFAEDVRQLDLDPNEASQLIESKDQSLHYAPKIESNVPALRFLGKEQHQVLEDIYLANQYHGQDGLGGYLYGYSVPDISKTEKKKAGGDLRGAYNYINGDGQEIKVEYWDDGTGFHQVDNVAEIAPQQVEDTPEVKAAKDEFFRIWQEQATRNQQAPQDPNENDYDSHSTYQHQGQASYGQQNQGQASYGQQNQGQFSTPNYPRPQQPIGQSQPQGHFQGQFSSSQGSIQSTFAPQFSSPRPQQFGISSTVAPNVVDYSGQYSEKRQVYANGPQQQQQPRQGKSQEEEEENNGPPRGFFYSFDYPVGIIVQKQGGVQKREDLQTVYQKNKEEFQQQLQSHGDYRPTRAAGYPSYLIVA